MRSPMEANELLRNHRVAAAQSSRRRCWILQTEVHFKKTDGSNMAQHADRSLLEAALVGYQSQLPKITTSIADLQKRLGNAGAAGVPAPLTRTPRRKRSLQRRGPRPDCGGAAEKVGGGEGR